MRERRVLVDERNDLEGENLDNERGYVLQDRSLLEEEAAIVLQGLIGRWLRC
jgi:hypothetical protein